MLKYITWCVELRRKKARFGKLRVIRNPLSLLHVVATPVTLTPQFMISRTTENVANKDELTDAFKLLTDGGDKPYITASELYAAMPPDQVTIQPPSYPYCSNKSRPSRTPHETECWSPQTLQRVRAVERTLANSPRISLNATRTCILSLSIVSEFRL